MFKVVNYYHIANWLYKKKIPYLPKLIDYLVRFVFSCWLPHTVKIGKNLILGYGGLGIVIHSDATIGDAVHIDQGVTIGGNGRELGTPSIGDNVYIGAGAKILGPIEIGSGTVIGANAVVVSSVPENCVAVGVPAKVIKHDIDANIFLHHRKVAKK